MLYSNAVDELLSPFETDKVGVIVLSSHNGWLITVESERPHS